jgi:hypothetical protein
VIPMTSRVNKVLFDVSHIAFDVSSFMLGVRMEYMLLLIRYVVTPPYVSSLAFYIRCVQMYRDFDL